MTSLTTRLFGTPTSIRRMRTLDATGDRAVDALADRTVWCATALPSGAAPAEALLTRLRWGGEQRVAAGALEIEPGEPLRTVAEGVDAMLGGTVAGPRELGPADEEVYAMGVHEAEALAGERVQADDVVVLNDPLTVLLAQPLRERGAHVIWHVGFGSRGSTSAGAREFLSRFTAGVDAYLVTARVRAGRGARGERVAALIPATDVLLAKEIASEAGPPGLHSRDIAWSDALADIVRGDRGESVGGTRHPRPAVAAR